MHLTHHHIRNENKHVLYLYQWLDRLTRNIDVCLLVVSRAPSKATVVSLSGVGRELHKLTCFTIELNSISKKKFFLPRHDYNLLLMSTPFKICFLRQTVQNTVHSKIQMLQMKRSVNKFSSIL